MKVNGVQNTTDIFLCLTAESKLIQIYNNTNLEKIITYFYIFFNFHFTELSW